MSYVAKRFSNILFVPLLLSVTFYKYPKSEALRLNFIWALQNVCKQTEIIRRGSKCLINDVCNLLWRVHKKGKYGIIWIIYTYLLKQYFILVFTMVLYMYLLCWTMWKYFASIPDKGQQVVQQLGQITCAVINTSNDVKCPLLWEFSI